MLQSARPAQVLQQLCVIPAAGSYAEDLIATLAQVLQQPLHQMGAVVG